MRYTLLAAADPRVVVGGVGLQSEFDHANKWGARGPSTLATELVALAPSQFAGIYTVRSQMSRWTPLEWQGTYVYASEEQA